MRYSRNIVCLKDTEWAKFCNQMLQIEKIITFWSDYMKKPVPKVVLIILNAVYHTGMDIKIAL